MEMNLCHLWFISRSKSHRRHRIGRIFKIDEANGKGKQHCYYSHALNVDSNGRWAARCESSEKRKFHVHKKCDQSATRSRNEFNSDMDQFECTLNRSNGILSRIRQFCTFSPVSLDDKQLTCSSNEFQRWRIKYSRWNDQLKLTRLIWCQFDTLAFRKSVVWLSGRHKPRLLVSKFILFRLTHRCRPAHSHMNEMHKLHKSTYFILI